MSIEGNFYHPTCFVCTVCSKPIGENDFSRESDGISNGFIPIRKNRILLYYLYQ